VTILQTVFGPEHPEAALTLNNLGVVQRDLGDLAAARASLERALEIEQAAYGSDQPGIGITMANLGVVLFQLGERAAARKALERAQAILLLRLAPSHPRVQVLERHLARIG
jgi:Tfp pilus assembly protein PilF